MCTYLLDNVCNGVYTSLYVDRSNTYVVVQNDYNNPDNLPRFYESKDVDDAASAYHSMLTLVGADCEPVLLTDYVNNGFHVVVEQDNAGYVVSYRNMNDGTEVAYRTIDRGYALARLEDWCNKADANAA